MCRTRLQKVILYKDNIQKKKVNKKEKKVMCRTMSIVNNKGGVGKTTTTLVLAELLAYLNKKVLVIDLDGQSNTTLTLHSYVQESEASINGRVAPIQENIFEVFVDRIREKEKLSKLIYKTNINGVDIIPSSSRFKNIEKNLEECYRSPFILAKAIKVIKDDYDYIIKDNTYDKYYKYS